MLSIECILRSQAISFQILLYRLFLWFPLPILLPFLSYFKLHNLMYWGSDILVNDKNHTTTDSFALSYLWSLQQDPPYPKEHQPTPTLTPQIILIKQLIVKQVIHSWLWLAALSQHLNNGHRYTLVMATMQILKEFTMPRLPVSLMYKSFSMNILCAGYKSPIQKRFLKNSVGNLFSALRFHSRLFNFCNFVIIFSLM